MTFLSIKFSPAETLNRYVWNEPDFPLHQTSSKWTYL